MRRWLAFLVLATVPALVSVARAQSPLPVLPSGSASASSGAPPASATAPAASATTAPATGGQVDPAEWQARYDAAGRRMVGGDYLGALQDYSALAATASSENARNLALEQLRVATEYAHRQQKGPPPTPTAPAPTSTGPSSALDVPPSELPPPHAHSPHARTGDELVFLYVATPLYGFTTGFWLDSLISKASSQNSYNNDGSATIGAFFVGLGATGLSALAVAMLDGGKKFKYGGPQSITTGLTVGFAEGVAMALWAGNRAADSQSSYTQFTSYLWGLSTVGVVAGSVVAATVQTTPGRSSWVGSTALASGFVLGGLAGALTPPTFTTNFNGYASSPDYSPSYRNLGITAAIGGLAGVGAGVLTAPLLSPSISRVRFIDLAWLSGGALSLGFCVAYSPNGGCDDRVRFGVMSAGVGVGFLVGALATMGMKSDPIEDHKEEAVPKEASFLDKLMPTMMPTQGGMTLGLAGQL